MKPIDFYRITKQHLEAQARKKGVRNLGRYYTLTDFQKCEFLPRYSETAQVFAQIAFHAQNATLLSNIVRFEKNIGFLSTALCGFDPKRFSAKFPAADRERSVQALVEALRFDPAAQTGLVWNAEKSKSGQKDTLIRRYANTLIDAAAFVGQFSSRAAFLQDLLNHYPNQDPAKVIAYFRKKVSHGFSVALTCDFLKEFDQSFSGLSKPDVHIKDTLCALYGRKPGYYNSAKKELYSISEMQKLVDAINEELPPEENITVYILDRMIWLVCSGKFFLDDAGNDKERYIQAIQA